jgi:hypothetical protein
MYASRFSRARAAALIILAVALALPGATRGQPRVYQGFGATTSGGTGGTVVRVTTLNDSGPGSLREAVSRGNRMVVFEVAGEIALSTYLYVLGANITIDGFTAPAPGITLKNYGLIVRGNKGAHDIIVRGIRIRGAAIDGIQVAYGAYNVVIDHVSVTGSADGNIDITEGSHDVTVSWSIIGANDKNMLVKYNTSRVTLHHNVFTASAQRSPQVRIDDSTTAVATDLTADIRNNVIANWGTGYGSVVWYGPWANVVNNFYAAVNAQRPLTVTSARAYVAGNLSPVLDDVNTQGTESAPFSAATVETHDACTAASLVLAEAGVRPLDAVDQQLLTGIAAPVCGLTPPTLASSPEAVNFQAVEGGANPSSQTVTIVNQGSDSAEWTASATTSGGGSWLAVSPATGNTPSSIRITVDTAGLRVGRHLGMITIEAQLQPGPVTSIPVVLDVTAAPRGTRTQQFAVAAREDDAREASTTVVVTDEPFLAVGRKDNLVAFRFSGVTIPRGSTISSAVLYLVATRKDSAYPIKIRYLGEAADHSSPLAAEPGSLSERLKTASFVDEVPGPWPVHQYTASPDLSTVVAEIVARPDWRPGNALAIFIADNGSSGRRSLCAFDDRPERAALLTVTYEIP